MDSRKTRDRLWFGMLNAERMSRYYTRRSEQLDSRYKGITFGIALLPLIALALYQSGLPHTKWIVPVILSVAGFAELALIHFGLGSDTKAAKIMANQTTELAQQWRRLWIDQNRDGIREWIEMLETQEKTITAESIPYREDVNLECAKEAKHGLAIQFGG